MDDHFSLWFGLASIAAVYGLFVLFEKVSKNEVDHPGEEMPIPGAEYSNNPFENYVPPIEKTIQP
jgi:hypothetical protein